MKSLMSWLRLPSVLWATSSLALAGLIIAVALGGLTWKYGSLEAALGYLRGRQLVLLPGVLELGEGQRGERREARLQLVNLTDRPAKILGANSTCSCLVVPSELPTEIPAHESRALSVVLTYVGDQSVTSQTVTVYSDFAGDGSASALIRGHISTSQPALVDGRVKSTAR